MNHYACSNSQGGLRFITAFLAEYEPATRTLTYINAGHNQPILRHNSGHIERLDAGGLPFGIKGDASYLTGTVAVVAGDLARGIHRWSCRSGQRARRGLR
jgi:phosphoserine phosphatase RsbU/P